MIGNCNSGGGGGGGGNNYNMGHYDPQASNFGPMKNNYGGGGGRNYGKIVIADRRMCQLGMVFVNNFLVIIHVSYRWWIWK